MTEPHRSAGWVVRSGGLKESCITWGPDAPCEGAIFRGKACSSMPDYTLPWAVQKWLNRSRCRLGCGLG